MQYNPHCLWQHLHHQGRESSYLSQHGMLNFIWCDRCLALFPNMSRNHLLLANMFCGWVKKVLWVPDGFCGWALWWDYATLLLWGNSVWWAVPLWVNSMCWWGNGGGSQESSTTNREQLLMYGFDLQREWKFVFPSWYQWGGESFGSLHLYITRVIPSAKKIHLCYLSKTSSRCHNMALPYPSTQDCMTSLPFSVSGLHSATITLAELHPLIFVSCALRYLVKTDIWSLFSETCSCQYLDCLQTWSLNLLLETVYWNL